MEFLILTGLSGAGNTIAVEMLEDIDFVCIAHYKFCNDCTVNSPTKELVASLSGICGNCDSIACCIFC